MLHCELLNRNAEYLGFSDFSSELATLDQIVAPTNIENLYLIPAGRHCPNPTMLLSDSAFSALLDRLLSDYDRVIVDSAPVNAVSDTLLLARHFNAVCLVVRIGKTQRATVERAVRPLEQSGANIVGTILNRLPRGYGADYYYYYYKTSIRGRY